MVQLPPSKKPRLTTEYTVNHLRRFYNALESLSFRKFIRDNDLDRCRANLAKIWKASGLDVMKKEKKPLHLAMQNLDLHLKLKKEMLNTSLKYLHQSNKYLTEDEIKVMVNITKLLESMGMGIDRQICLDIINAPIRTRTDEKDFKLDNKSIVQ